MTSRRWCFTVNNPEQEGQEFLDSIPTQEILHVVFQLEQGESGTNHFQGFVIWKSPIRCRQCVQRLGGRAHVERTMGTDKQAAAYSSKEDTRMAGPWQYGEVPHQGQRNDLAAIQLLCKAGAKRKTILDEHFGAYMRYHRGIEIARLEYAGRRHTMPVVNVLWGPTETGKSRKAWEIAGEDAFVLMPPNVKGGPVWFDGYDGQKSMIIEEFYGWIRWGFLLTLLDRYPMRTPTKGGSVEFNATKIVICSNKDPRNWYRYREGMEWATLNRRFESITHMNVQLEPSVQ